MNHKSAAFMSHLGSIIIELDCLKEKKRWVLIQLTYLWWLTAGFISEYSGFQVNFRCLTACILSLEEDLLSSLMVLCIFPSSFGEDPAAEILDCQHSRIALKSLLRKLKNRELLEGNSSTGRYALPLLVRSTGRALSRLLGTPLVCISPGLYALTISDAWIASTFLQIESIHLLYQMRSFAVKLNVPPLRFSTIGWRPIPICMSTMGPEHWCRGHVSSQSILIGGVMQDSLVPVAW